MSATDVTITTRDAPEVGPGVKRIKGELADRFLVRHVGERAASAWGGTMLEYEKDRVRRVLLAESVLAKFRLNTAIRGRVGS